MSNTIKLKRGSGSDPQASDLEIGEIAIRTDQGKLFTKKDNGSVAEISGGSGVGLTDGDKGDITVSNGGDTFTIDDGVVSTAKIADSAITNAKLNDNSITTAKINNSQITSAKIADNTIVNSDINASAAIAGTKISPNFGTQSILTKASAVDTDIFSIIRQDHSTTKLFRIFQDSSSGGGAGGCHINTTNRNLIITASVNAGDDDGLYLTSTGNLGIGENSPDEKLHIKNGNILLESTDASNSAEPIIELYRNSASPADADYLGQLKFTGESDDGSKEVYAKVTGKIDDASSGTEDGLIEFMTRKAGSNNICARLTSTDLKLINGTGLEVAGNITVTGTVDGRDVATDGTKLDGIESNATADQTASEILTLLKTVDGAGSGLDADTLDGISSASFLRSDADDSFTGTITGTSDIINPVIKIQGSGPNFIQFASDATGTVDADSINFIYRTSPNTLGFERASDGNTLFSVDADDGTSHFSGNLNIGAGCDVTGNITVTGTVDGVDIATRDTLFGSLTSSSGVLSNGVTATTQAQSDNSNKVSTTAYVRAAVANLVNSAPNTLDTLNELAAALGDDANFSTTVTNSIGTKLPLAGGTLTGGLTGTTAVFSSTSTVPALEAKGDGSSTDGYIQLNCSQNSHGIKLSSPAHSAGASYTFIFPSDIQNGKFLTTDANGNTSWGTPTDTNTQLSNEQVQDIVGAMVSSNTESGITVTYQDTDGTLDFAVASQTDNNFTNADHTKLDGIEANATADQTASEILTLIKTVDGAGSGLDADTLDGISSASFLRSDASDTMTGSLTIGDGTAQTELLIKKADNNVSDHIQFYNGTTRVGEIGCEDNTWLRINQETNKNIYTPRIIRADGGFQVDGTTIIDGSGNIAYSRLTGTPTIPTNNNQLTNGAGYVTQNTQLTNEQVQDIVGAMVESNTETNITVTYDDTNGKLNFASTDTNTQLSTEQVQDIIGDMVSSNTESGITVTYQDADGTLDFSVASQTDENFTTALKNKLDAIAANATNVTNNNQLTNGAGYITSAALAGASDGGNAALLDGIDSTQFLRADQDDSTTGILSLETNSQYPLTIDGDHDGKIILKGSNNPYIRFAEGTTNKAYIQWNSAGYLQLSNQESGETIRIKSGNSGLVFFAEGTERTVYHTGNLTVGDGGLTDNNFTDADHSKLNGIESGATADQTASEILTLIKTVDGAGSGLDADTLDGISSASFLRADASDTMVGNFTLDGNFNMSSSHVFNHNNTASKDKIRVWNASSYAIGMDDAMSFGGLNDYAMTFTMNDDSDRGFIWRDTSHNDAQGAMSLTTNGKLALAHSIRVGYGESDTTTPGSTYKLDVSGNANISGNIVCSGTIDGADVASMNSKLAGIESGATADQTASEILTLIKTVDGSGSGLDADTLDGISSGSFIRSDATDTMSGQLTSTNHIRIDDHTKSFQVGDISNDNYTGLQHVTGSSTIRGFGIGNVNASVLENLQGTTNQHIVLGDSSHTASTILFGVSASSGSTYYTRLSLTGTGNLDVHNNITFGGTITGDGSGLTGIAAGATGGGSDQVFYENGQTVTTNYTITNGKNAMSAGPITINSGVTVTVGSGETWTVV